MYSSAFVGSIANRESFERSFRGRGIKVHLALAHEVGLHRTYVGATERGEQNVSMLNLARSANALRTPLSRLIALPEFLGELAPRVLAHPPPYPPLVKALLAIWRLSPSSLRIATLS